MGIEFEGKKEREGGEQMREGVREEGREREGDNAFKVWISCQTSCKVCLIWDTSLLREASPCSLMKSIVNT